MYAALNEAEIASEQNEIPIGAVVVKDNKIIGRGHNQTELLKDNTAHAEMIAITAAGNHLNSKILEGCDLYVTVEPCVMCVGAILLTKIKNLYFGAFEPKFGACGSVYNIIDKNKYNHRVKVFSNILESESQNLLKEYFIKKRTTKKK
ncbi:MAG: nucleoside deaminase [Ignavibacteriales bacterium]|nr:nucleoside deaminase [Ignavibacteriales bacterium]